MINKVPVFCFNNIKEDLKLMKEYLIVKLAEKKDDKAARSKWRYMYGMSDNFRFCDMENLKGNFHEKMDGSSRMQARWKWKIRPCTTYSFLKYNFFLHDLKGKYISEENHEKFLRPQNLLI